MNEIEFVEYLDEIINFASEEDGMVVNTRTFRDVGMLTNNEGLVVKLESGETFQITVVKSS